MTVSIAGTMSTVRRSLDELFSQSVLKYPARPALFTEGRLWSYAELDGQCLRIERVLPATGTDTSRNVGLIYGRGMFSYAAIIAVMRSRRAYVPLNPKMPSMKLLSMIEDAGIGTLIVDAGGGLSEGVIEVLRQARSLRIIVQEGTPTAVLESALANVGHPAHLLISVSGAGAPLQAVELPLEQESVDGQTPHDTEDQESRENPGSAADLAYIIYTSGSTGVPKGVAITHESAYTCIEKSHRLFETCENDRFTQFSALSFDVSILDLFLCWKSGAALFVAAPSEALVPMSFVTTHGITVWSSVPSLANFLLKLRLLKRGSLAQVRLFLFCGEALPVELAQACLEAAPRSRVLNLYGPTETTIFATWHEYDEQSDRRLGTVPIGKPLPGMDYMIVDEGRMVETEDEPGELWLSGDQLARGYWGNAAATQAAFVRVAASHGSSGNLWYRTGDRVSRHSPHGLSFHGRLDRQVKLRGFRVELQEVESALREITGCAVVAVVPVRNNGGICEKIVAYCDELAADEAAVKARCLSRIAHYMVPDRILRLETFPLNDSGKIDYLALARAARVGVECT